jgi:type II secretory pathway component PulF
MSAIFRYEARAPSGRLERGTLAASDRQDALQRLHRRQLTPLSLRSGPSASQRLSVVAARDLSRTLAQLLRSGLSFAQALRFASEELPPASAAAAAAMREAAEAGDPASSALETFRGAEARLLKGVILAGETSGKLADALDVAAHSFARSAELQGRVSTALIYPAFVIIATFATLACFLLIVVPTMAQAFEGAEDRLPPETRTLLSLSAWLQANGLYLLAGLAAIIALALSSTEMRAFSSAMFDRLMASPLAMGVTPRLEFAAFARLSALSLDAGVPSGTAFDSAAGGARNSVVRDQLRRAVNSIRMGERPSAALGRCASAPKAFLRLVSVGEETGKLADALRNASALLSTEAEQRLERLGSIAGPIVTLALGGVVASIVMALFLGLLSMSDLAAI